MKFRIKEVDGIGFFAQVKHGWFYSWKRIGRHCDGFGLYDDDGHPHAMVLYAENACRDYKKWYKKQMAKPTYYDYEVL